MHLGRGQFSFSFVLLIGFIFAIHGPFATAQSPADLRAYVMDTETNKVYSTLLPAGTVVESPKLEETPSLMVLSPDGSRLLVFERNGRGRGFARRLEMPPLQAFGEPTALSIFDTRDMKLIVRLKDVGWNASAHPFMRWPEAEISAAWDSSGQLLTILAWGKHDKNPELVQLDVSKGSIAGRRPLDCESGEVNALLPISGDTAAVLYGRRDIKPKANVTHKLVFVNLKNLADSKEVSLAGIPRNLARSPDGEHVFVLADDGAKITEAGQAHLHVLSASTRSLLQTIDGGFFLADAEPDPDSTLTLISRMGKKGVSTVFIFDGDKKKAEIDIQGVTLKTTLAPKTRRAYVLCYNSIEVIDLDSLKLVGSIPTPHRTRGFWESGQRNRPPSNMALDPAEGTGILGYSGDDELSVLDLKELKVKGTIDLISGAKAFGKIMLVAAATGALAGAGSAAAGTPIMPMTPLPSSPKFASSVVDSSGQFVYILGGTGVHVADLSTYKKVTSVSVPFTTEYAFSQSQAQGKNPWLFVVGLDIGASGRGHYRMAVLDMTTRERVLKQEWRGHCLYSSDRKFAVNYDSENLYLLDGATLSAVKTVGNFKELRQLLLAP